MRILAMYIFCIDKRGVYKTKSFYPKDPGSNQRQKSRFTV
jgi:hypothetical protein